MRHISDLTRQPSDKSAQSINEPGPSVKPQSAERMEKLWERMAMMYGHRWKANFGLRDDGTWARGLAGLSAKQLGAGLARCLERKLPPGQEDWGPTLNEFRAMCLAEREHPSHRLYAALPKPPQDPQKVNAAIEKMRTTLAKAR